MLFLFVVLYVAFTVIGNIPQYYQTTIDNNLKTEGWILSEKVLDSVENINTGLVSSWHFDEGSGDIAFDEIRNKNDGAVYGATWVDGKVGSALSFNGVDNYVEVGDDSSFDLTDITVEVWAKASLLDADQHRHIITKDSGTGASDNEFQIRYNKFNQKWEFWVSNGVNWDKGESNNVAQEGTWYNLVGRYDSSINEISLFVNGIKQTTTGTISSIQLTDNPIQIGRQSTFSPTSFNGIIDEVRIYNRALSADEIALLGCHRYHHYDQASMSAYESLKKGFSVGNINDFQITLDVYPVLPNTRAVGVWSFDENFGQFANDSSDYNNDGTLGSTTEIDDNDPTWVDGKVGSALSFDGEDDYVEILEDDSLDITEAGSVCLWFKWENSNSYEGLIQKGTLSNLGNYDMHTIPTNKLRISYGGTYTDSTTSVNDNSWHFACSTYDGNNIILYLDGINEAQTTDSSVSSNNENLVIGQYYGSTDYTFNGIIDEVRIYNRALSADEIRTEYLTQKIDRVDSANNIVIFNKKLMDCGKISSLEKTTTKVQRYTTYNGHLGKIGVEYW